MKTKDIAAGILTALPYYADPGGYHAQAEHDELYLFATDGPMVSRDIDIMITLGWTQQYAGRDYAQDFTVQDYRPGEPWHCHT